MRIRMEIDVNCQEPEVILRTHEVTEEIHEIMKKLSSSNYQLMTGFDNDSAHLLDVSDIIRIYAANKKVFARTAIGQELTLRLRLYEIEERLDKTQFIRISNSEIVNLKAVKKLDLSISGSIALTFSNKETTYVSRRYVTKIKQILGI